MLGLTLPELGERVGVSRDSIYRWEFAYVSPRPIALIVWAQKLTYSVALQSITTELMTERPTGHDLAVAPSTDAPGVPRLTAEPGGTNDNSEFGRAAGTRSVF